MILDIKKAHVYFVSNMLLTLIIAGLLFQLLCFLIAPFDGLALSLFNTMENRPMLGLIHRDIIGLIVSLFNVFIVLSLTLYLYQYKPLLTLIALTFGLIGITLYMSQHTIIELYKLYILYQTQNPFYLNQAQLTLDLHYGTAFIMSNILLSISWLLYGITFVIAKNVTRLLSVITIIHGLMTLIAIFVIYNSIYIVFQSIVSLGFYSLLWLSFHQKIKTIQKEVST